MGDILLFAILFFCWLAACWQTAHLCVDERWGWAFVGFLCATTFLTTALTIVIN